MKIIAHHGGNGAQIKPMSVVVYEKELRERYKDFETPLPEFLAKIPTNYFEYYGYFEIQTQTKKPFPICSNECEIVELLGVCECESVCPYRFDKDGNPLKEV